MEPVDIPTSRGPARAHMDVVDEPLGLLVLGHGAGGGVQAPDLLAARAAALSIGWAVARVEQPYRVAGRRSPAPAAHLDEAWPAAVAHLRAALPGGTPVVTGGRSSGARVACRTAGATGSAAVLCLAFPLHPPRRRPDAPRKTRIDELDAVEADVLVIQGTRDPFGMPPPAKRRRVVTIEGDHSLRGGGDEVAAAVASWLPRYAASGSSSTS